MEANRAASHVEFFAKACTAILEVVENGRYRVKNYRERLQSIPYLDITLGTSKNATFLLRGASIAFIFHRLSSWFAPAEPIKPPAASRPTAPACLSIFRTAAPPGGRTFQFRG